MNYVSIDPKSQERRENYKLLIGSVLPRPIAFVTSMNGEGLVNAAPFSFYNVVCTDPPLLGISCGRRSGSVPKDTSRNIMETKEFVIHVVDTDNVSMVNETGIDFPPDVSEVDELGFHVIESENVRVPRLKEAKIQMECKLHRIIGLGGTEDQPTSDFIIGEVVRFHIAESLYQDGKIDTDALSPIGRLAGRDYAKVGETFAMPRLTFEEYQEQKKKK
ncbi:MAG: flavin reductase family protein [Bacillaceae bacterium]|nr:flavin reductase family protein [Bacillaceae bacterium]